MKILIVKFRTNDLDPSYGKQVEFSSKNIQEFFEFENSEERITFIYNDYNFRPLLDKTSINGYLKLSPARGDYKVYQNLDGSLFIKDFFIRELGLSLAANKDDFFTLTKNSSTEYFLSYIPNNSDLGKFISKNNLSGKIVDVQKDESDEFVNKSLGANIQSSNFPLQRIIFGAPGTGKSWSLNEQAKKCFGAKKEKNKLSDDEKMKLDIQKVGSATSERLAIGIKYNEKLKDKNPKQIKKDFLCNENAAYAISQGTKIKKIAEEIENISDDDLNAPKILELIKGIKTDKQASYAAIGYKFSQFFYGMTYGSVEITLNMPNDTSSAIQWILAGARIKECLKDEEVCADGNEIRCIERVTFHPNYSYAQFVGTYKPVQDEDDEKQIKYEYVSGPFLKVYCNAKRNPDQKYLLLIEEINRANVAAVFGNVFQLLDRKNGVSEYPIATSKDVKKYLKDKGIDDCEELKIPSNMYIWATMNSADQGVFPMDTAFKRRWEFEYIGINDSQEGIEKYEIPLEIKRDEEGNIIGHEWKNWNKLRHSINDKLTEMKINEDKLLGPYFISEEKLKLVEGKKEENADEFVKSFKSKVLMYLFEDAAKMHHGDLFDENAIGRLRFSDICAKFDEIGQSVFNFKK